MSRSTSPKRKHRRKPQASLPTCAASGKVAHPSRKRALGAMHDAARKWTTTPVAVYRCPHCREWHLTSVPPRPR